MNTSPRRLVGIAFLTFVAITHATGADDARSLVDKGARLLHEANETILIDPEAAQRLYAQSALCFERVIDSDIRNAPLYYNAGNARFQAGDIGRAILNYRRAERLAPGDDDLLHNLSHVRKQREDSIPESNQSRALRTVLFWHYDLPAPVRAIIFALAYLAFWVAAIILLFRRRAELRWTAIVAFALAMLFAGSLALDLTRPSRAPEGVVLADEVIARQGDGAAYRPAFSTPIHAGSEFRLVEAREKWLRVELSDGRKCWIPAHAAEVI